MDWQLDVGVAEATALKLSEALVAARKREEEARRSARTRGAKAHQRNGWREDEEKLSPAPSCVNLFKTGIQVEESFLLVKAASLSGTERSELCSRQKELATAVLHILSAGKEPLTHEVQVLCSAATSQTHTQIRGPGSIISQGCSEGPTRCPLESQELASKGGRRPERSSMATKSKLRQ